MPKKNRKPRKPTTRRRPPSGYANPAAVRRLLAELEQHLVGDGLPAEATWLVNMLVDLKRDYLESPDATEWTRHDVETLLVDIVPRKVMLDHEDHQMLLPVVARYFDFLVDTGRWSPRSDDRDLLGVHLDQIADDVRAALTDPARRSVNGNILQFAVSEGVDVADPAELESFITRYNDLPDDDRDAVARTGSLSVAASAEPADGAFRRGSRPPLRLVGDDERAGSSDPADPGLAGLWPDCLGPAPDPDRLPEPDFDDDDAADFFASSVLQRRASALLEWLGAGRPVTSTGALRRDDTSELMRLLGLRHSEDPPRSMWDVLQLRLLWKALNLCGFVDTGATRAVPGSPLVPWPASGAPAIDVVHAGVLLHSTVLLLFFDADEHRPYAAPLTLSLLTLLKAAEPNGFQLEWDDPRTYDDTAVVRSMVHGDLERLVTAGLLTQEASTFRLSVFLLPSLATAVDTMRAVDGEP